MPAPLISGLTEALNIALALYGDAKATRAMNSLVAAVREYNMALARIDGKVNRLLNAPFLIGLAHLDDANAVGRSVTSRYQFLELAREKFKEAAVVPLDPAIRAAGALFCAVCWIETNHLGDGARWSMRAAEIANEALGEIRKRQPPPSPRPARGVLDRFVGLAGSTEVPEPSEWYATRLEDLNEVLALSEIAHRVLAELDPSAPVHRPMRLYPAVPVLGSRYPLILDVYKNEPFPAGTAWLTIVKAKWHMWQDQRMGGALDVLLHVEVKGEFLAHTMGVTTADGWGRWMGRLTQDRGWISPRERSEMVSGESSPWISRGGVVQADSDVIHLLFDADESPPEDLLLVVSTFDYRGALATFTWGPGTGDPYIPPAPEEEKYEDTSHYGEYFLP